MPHFLKVAQPNWRLATSALALSWALASPSLGYAQDAERAQPNLDIVEPLDSATNTQTPSNPAPALDVNSDLEAPDPQQAKSIRKDLLTHARAITEPGERSLALQRVGASKQFTEDYDEALQAYLEAGEAAVQAQDRLIHDLRLISVIRGLTSLSNEFRREAVMSDIPALELSSTTEIVDEAKNQSPQDKAKAKTTLDNRLSKLDQIEEIANHAQRFASQLHRITYRCEQRHQIAEAIGTQTLDLFSELTKSDSLAVASLIKNRDALSKKGDGLFRTAAQIAASIERPVWRDRSLLTVAIDAAAAKRFDLSLEIARSIPASETRAETLIRLADAIARDEGSGDKATGAFAEAARAVAAIPMEDLRKSMTWQLIEALISNGRFEDARASISLYGGDPYAIAYALGAVAESQGRRGLGTKAREWIANVTDSDLQSKLRRRVLDGELSAVNATRNQTSGNLFNINNGSGLGGASGSSF